MLENRADVAFSQAEATFKFQGFRVFRLHQGIKCWEGVFGSGMLL